MKSNKELVNFLVEKGFIKSIKIAEAFSKTDRKKFVRKEHTGSAYENIPLPIASERTPDNDALHASISISTISQPSTVAAMTEALSVENGQKILEIGTGSGYQSALLSLLVGSGRIITAEISKEVHEFGKKNLKNYKNVEPILSGSLGYSKEAPYDRIIVTASASSLPESLIKQLKVGGIMIIPVAEKMFRITKKSETEIKKEFLGYYAFVPLK